MIPTSGLFETHLTVENLQRSLDFYNEVKLGILDGTSGQHRNVSDPELVQAHARPGGLP